MALALEEIGWGTAEHWMRLQATYDLARARRVRATAVMPARSRNEPSAGDHSTHRARTSGNSFEDRHRLPCGAGYGNGAAAGAPSASPFASGQAEA